MIRAGIALALVSAAVARAQSTETLGRADRPLQFQITAGTSASLAFDGSRDIGLSAGSISIRHPVDGGLIGLRAGVWATDWKPHCTYLCDDDVGHSRLVTTMLMADWPLHLPYDLAIEPVAGVGLAPYSHTTFPSAYPVQGDRRNPPYVFSAGVTLRWRWVVLEQHVFLLTSSNDYFHNTLAPLTVGVRF